MVQLLIPSILQNVEKMFLMASALENMRVACGFEPNTGTPSVRCKNKGC